MVLSIDGMEPRGVLDKNTKKSIVDSWPGLSGSGRRGIGDVGGVREAFCGTFQG
jgi:hypothetical protein